MSVARTARRVRKRMTQNNNHLSGRGVPRYKMPERVHIPSPAKRKKRST